MARPLDDLLINGEKLSARLSEMVTTARLERTMEGPSTLRVSLFDPDYWLTRESGIIGPRGFRTTASWQERSFTLAQLDKTIDGFDLEFIVTAAAKLSRKNDRYKKSRSRFTRARAAGALCSIADVAFADWPGVDARQPIQSFTRDENETLGGARSSAGAQATTRSRLARGALNRKGITIKGARATREQLRNIEICMSVADQFGAPVKPIIAMLIAGIGESGFQTAVKNYDTGDATGVFQILASTAAALGITDRTDTAVGAEAFLVGVKKGASRITFNGMIGGAVALARQQPDLSAPEITYIIEGRGASPSFYAPYVGEAEKIIRAWSPGDEVTGDDVTALTGTPDRARRKTYEFRVNPGESFYEALVRWAEEVNWRFFILDTPEHRDGMVWFIDDLTLAAATPSAVIAEGDPGVDRILYSRTRRGRIDQCTVQGRANFWDYTPGQCVVVNGEGDPADGRWLIRSIEHDLLDDLNMVDVTLGQPQRPKPEPKPSIITATGSDPVDKRQDPDSQPAKGGLEVGYPLAIRGKDIGGAAAHGQRAFGNWQSDNAVDIAVPSGIDVFAVQDGEIVKLGGAWISASANPNGYNVTLKSADNQWFYTHLRERSPALFVGKKVERGDYFGKSGSANGVEHLHIGCEKGDPENLLGLP